MILALGTAQLGIHYGVNNSVGKLSDEQAYSILDTAYWMGFQAVDTSRSYGEAQSRVDRYLEEHLDYFEVLRRNEEGYESVYTEQEAVVSKAHTIQLPANCLDGRMDGVIKRLQGWGKRVVVRSFLLQGLLGTDPFKDSPDGNIGSGTDFFLAAKPYLNALRVVAAFGRMSVVELAVRWAWRLMPDVALFGAESQAQVEEISSYWIRGRIPEDIEKAVIEVRRGVPDIVISPRMWGQDYGFTS